jgi:Na+-transporting NADH:ubiquinone oxidoreductase subunit NqrC
MKIVMNKKGSTLLVVLVLSAVALVIVAGLLYMVTQNTKLSGSSRQYKNALEAAKAGADVFNQVINNSGKPPSLVLANFTIGTQLATKLTTSTAGWVGLSNTITIDPNDTTTYDVTFDLGTSPAYRVYGKIVDTVPGNSSSNAIPWHKGGTVNSQTASGGGGSGNIMAQSHPYMYTIEILSQQVSNPLERAKLSVVYQY